MPIRRLAGLAGIIVAAWMLWETVQPIQMQISRGSDLMTELLNPPVALLRLTSTLLMILGGLLAILAVRRGAYDFLEKPFDPKRLEETVARAAERTRLLAANRALVAATPTRELVFEDPAMERVAGLADRAAASSATVLLLGESGTGKEVLARRVHETSPRREGPFVAVNCAALSETLLESELFGHEAGAFTGATRRRAGKIEASHGGTLFLDEIGDTTPGFQKRLLRVLQEHRFERVGGDRSIEVDLRCIAATNRDLKAMVEAGTFREDLYYRLNVIALELPPLRARRGDVRRLAEHFCAHFAIALGRPGLSLGGAAHAALAAHDWPGNVRELRNVLERAAVLAEGTEITPLDLPPELCATLDGGASEHGGPSDSAGPCAGFHAQVEAFRKRLLADTLAAHDGHQTRAAESLGLQRSYFARLLKKYDLKD